MTRELAKLMMGNIVVLVLLALLLRFGVLYHSHKSASSSYAIAIPPKGNKTRFLEVPRIVWGLNNQKIAFARACLTARHLNRTLLMPTLSGSLFYKEVEPMQPMPFDEVFKFDEFNSLCRGFVQLARISDVPTSAKPLDLVKGSGRRWTSERDLTQLNLHTRTPYSDREIIRVKGKNPFLWHDHWPVKDYARVFGCLEFVDDIVHEAVEVITRIRAVAAGSNPRQTNNIPYLAVHMRIEKDWMIHCRNLERRLKTNQICSSKEEIMERVSRVPGMPRPSIIYLAVADDLLEDGSILSGWKDGIFPVDKRGIGAWDDVYEKHPYLVRSAIDFHVCSRADIFVGNSFSTFSNLVVLERTRTLVEMGVMESCGGGGDVRFASYAYNIVGDGGGPKKWMANMADGNLQALSYGTVNISCNSFFDGL